MKRQAPACEALARHHPARELARNLAVADDRSRDELRKQKEIERGLDRALLRVRVTAIDVYDVRNRVKGEERDPDWKNQMGHGVRAQPKAGPDDIHGLDKERRVLEDPQHQQIGAHGEGEQRARQTGSIEPMDPDRHRVVEDDRRRQEVREASAALRVEQDACRQQQRVAPRAERGEVESDQDREKAEEKRRFGKQHRRESTVTSWRPVLRA